MSHAAILSLDDGISGHPGHSDAVAASKIRQKDLRDAGFTTNEDKCEVGTWYLGT